MSLDEIIKYLEHNRVLVYESNNTDFELVWWQFNSAYKNSAYKNSSHSSMSTDSCPLPKY